MIGSWYVSLRTKNIALTDNNEYVKILDFYASGEKSKLFYIGDAAGKNGRGKREYIPLISQNIYIECNSQVDVNKLKMRVAFCENVIIKAPTIGTTIEKGDEISKLKTIWPVCINSQDSDLITALPSHHYTQWSPWG